jgi:hypothetical protein
MIRKIVAIVFGGVIAVVIVSGIDNLGDLVYPAPAGLDDGDPVAMRAHLGTLPLGARAFTFGGWVLATLAGGFVAAAISGERPLLFAGMVGMLVLGNALTTLLGAPYPVWFSITSVAAIPLMALLAGRMASH